MVIRGRQRRTASTPVGAHRHEVGALDGWLRPGAGDHADGMRCTEDPERADLVGYGTRFADGMRKAIEVAANAHEFGADALGVGV